jgi:hypothetical protein
LGKTAQGSVPEFKLHDGSNWVLYIKKGEITGERIKYWRGTEIENFGKET